GGGRGGVAPSSIRPMTDPTGTVAPSATVARTVPAAGATTSAVALSVSNSATGSSSLAYSPSFLSQRARTASVTDSPADGTLISTGIASALSRCPNGQSRDRQGAALGLCRPPLPDGRGSDR